MIRKDQRGYVFSGLGLLLLIPVLILIPIALSVEQQSSNIPSTFVKSDTVFDTLKNIYIDLNDKLSDFATSVNNKNFTNQNQLSTPIILLYNQTQQSTYQNAYGSTVDSIQITPTSAKNLRINSTEGIIPLKNGIVINYAYQGTNLTTRTQDYDMNVTINSTIQIQKGNVGTNKDYNLLFGEYAFYLPTNVDRNTFFSSLSATISSANICT
jgi:hypothetical protein